MYSGFRKFFPPLQPALVRTESTLTFARCLMKWGTAILAGRLAVRLNRMPSAPALYGIDGYACLDGDLSISVSLCKQTTDDVFRFIGHCSLRSWRKALLLSFMYTGKRATPVPIEAETEGNYNEKINCNGQGTIMQRKTMNLLTIRMTFMKMSALFIIAFVVKELYHHKRQFS